ncbi:MAG: ABC transporter ATP-binding protein [Clostridiaceae bacterium]|nr:ABC transporter ATP-binding protein [Clostridiaceae bacterium]
MKEKTYRLLDFLAIPFRAAPVLTAWILISLTITALVPSMQVIATARFVDTALAYVGGDTSGNILVSLIYIMLIVGWQYLSWSLQTLSTTKLELRLNETFREQTVEKRARLEYRHIENNEAWDLIGRVCKEPATRIKEGFDNLTQLASGIVTVVAVLALLMAQVWWAGLIIIGFVFPLFMVSMKAGKRQYDADREAEKYTRRANYLATVLTEREGAEERTVFGYTEALNRRWFEKYEAARKITQREELRRFIQIKGTGLITVGISVAIAFVLLFPLRSGELSPGTFIGLVTAVFSLVQSLSWGLPWAVSQLAKNRAYLDDLTKFSGLSEREGATDIPARLDGFRLGTVEFDHVSFRYPGTQTYILKDFTFTMHEGVHYALVGANGAGKTTLTKLLTGQYDNYEGTIRIAGRDLREYTLAELKSVFSVVYQDFARYFITMRNNIEIGDLRTGACPDVEGAMRLIELDGVAEKLPHGADTPLGKISEGGSDLSGGEWQKVALARCIASPGAVRILDEPTAALDPMAESRVYELFGRISAGHTTVFITHRLGAARLADEIVVLADGRVAESGSHTDLIAKDGIYAEMFASQSAWYRSEKEAIPA